MELVGDWIKENCSTVGIGFLNLTGANGEGNARFGDHWSVATSVWYIIIDGINRETGRGTFNGVAIISRDTIDATLVNGVFDGDNPDPIYLNGSAIVGCAFSGAAYNEMIPALETGTIHIADLDNPHDTTALKIPYESSADPVTNEDTVQDAMHDHATSIEERVASRSGIIEGGILSGSGTTFSVTAGSGKIFDSSTIVTNTGVKDVTWPARVAITLEVSALNIGRTSIFMSEEGNVTQVVGAATGAHFRDYIFLGAVHNINGVITEVDNAPSVIKQSATDLYDLFYASIDISGCDITGVTAALQVWLSEGSFFFPGVNYYSDVKNPNIISLVQQGDDTTPITIKTLYMDGSTGADVTTIPTSYNTTGDTLVALVGNNATIHRLYNLGIQDGSRAFLLLYGQESYGDASVARDNRSLDDTSTIFPTETSQMQYLGMICVSGDSTDFSDIASAWIVNDTAGGSGGSIATTDPDAVKWQGDWQSGALYNKNDWAIEGPWGGVVVADSTQDRLFPQREGDALFKLPDVPAFSSAAETAQVKTGIRITNILDVLAVDSLRVYISDISANVRYRLVRRNNHTGGITLGPVFSGDKFDTIGWININVTPVLLKAGADVTIFLVLSKYDTTTDFNHPYIYAGDNKASVPAEGEVWRDKNEKIRISTTEEGGSSGGRYADLLSAVPGTFITLEDDVDSTKFVEYEVITQTDNTLWFEYDVARISVGAGGYPAAEAAITLYFAIPVALSVPYVYLTDHWISNDQYSGVLQIGVNPESSTQHAYGLDMFTSDYTVSDDWDITSYVGAPLAPAVVRDNLTGDGVASQALSAGQGFLLEQGKEDALGNPGTDSQSLVSLDDGTRGWETRVAQVVAGTNVTIDSSDPFLPVVNVAAAAVSSNSNIARSDLLKGVLSLSNLVTTLVQEIITYTGNGAAQDVATNIPSRDINYNAATTYQIGYLAFDKATFKLWEALTINTGVALVEGANWTEIADDVVKDHPNSKLWIKNRDTISTDHIICDTIRGDGRYISSNLTSAEAYSAAYPIFTDTGFTVGIADYVNGNTDALVAWQTSYAKVFITTTNEAKRALVAFDTVSNRSMVLYQGSSTDGHVIPHGLGVVPDSCIIKNLGVITDWYCHNMAKRTGYLELNQSAGLIATNYDSCNPSDMIMGNTVGGNDAGETHIAYCEASSDNIKVGVYTGTGIVGNIVHCGFKPAYIVTKSITADESWLITDNKRSSFDVYLRADTDVAESSALIWTIDADGFTSVSANQNGAGTIYLFMAYADTNADGGGSYADLPSDATELQIADGVIGYSDGYDASGAVNSAETAVGTIIPTNAWANSDNYVKKTEASTYVSSLIKPVFGVVSAVADYYLDGKWFDSTGTEYATPVTYLPVVVSADGNGEIVSMDDFNTPDILVRDVGGLDTPIFFGALETAISSESIINYTAVSDTHQAYSAGVYTIPKAGWYRYAIKLEVSHTSTTMGRASIKTVKNGIEDICYANNSGNSSYGTYGSAAAHITTYLEKGDTLHNAAENVDATNQIIGSSTLYRNTMSLEYLGDNFTS